VYSGRAIFILCAIRFRVNDIFWHKKKKIEFGDKALQNGGEIQGGRQTRMFRISLKLHLNRLKLWI
jgi:hypothetical protein